VPVVPAYVKDYDALPGQHPREWPRRWDVSKWWIVGAFVGEQRVGGAVVVIDAREMDGATAAADAALLWDIRVHPDFRRRGVGRALLALAESHARACGRRGMRVETQDINVAACRLYADAGYVLTAINPCAYADVPDEVQLIWEKQLDV
jgi:ribosomal protein S18 acetylase RimI-like enzyme